MTRYTQGRPRVSEAQIAAVPAPTPKPTVTLNLRQQRNLAEVIDAAQQSPGSLRHVTRGNWIYTAQHRNGRTRWVIQDVYRNLVADGFAP